jgi:hypothetical protein
MVYLYAAAAGTADVLAGWFALRLDAEKIQRRYVIPCAAVVLVIGMAFVLALQFLGPVA